MIFELKFYVNDQGHQIQARRPDPSSREKIGDLLWEFAFNGTMRYTMTSPEGKTFPMEAPLSFSIPGNTVHEAFDAFPALYKTAGDALLDQMRANIQANKEAELRRILTN